MAQNELMLDSGWEQVAELTLPLPPSSNAMYTYRTKLVKAERARGTIRCPCCQRSVRAMTFPVLTNKSREFSRQVEIAADKAGVLGLGLDGRLAMWAGVAFASSAAKQDAPNRLKLTQDALTNAQVYVDDSHVDVTHIERLGKQKGGAMIVRLYGQ